MAYKLDEVDTETTTKSILDLIVAADRKSQE